MCCAVETADAGGRLAIRHPESLPGCKLAEAMDSIPDAWGQTGNNAGKSDVWGYGHFWCQFAPTAGWVDREAGPGPLLPLGPQADAFNRAVGRDSLTVTTGRFFRPFAKTLRVVRPP